MKFDIYCDESHPDVFRSKSDQKAKYLLIGGIWIPTEIQRQVKLDFRTLREKHDAWHEIKWHKANPSRRGFYHDLIDLFMAYGENMRFRCIAVEADKVDLVKFHEGDSELGFYKFYYQLIKHWIDDFNQYRIFCDLKTNRRPYRLRELRRALDHSNFTSIVESVQAVCSREVSLIQLTDFLLGLVSAKMNRTYADGSLKAELVAYLEKHLGHKIGPTSKTVKKLNVFKIDLQGGW